ncbi:GNAT family N-acetyltransferase [Notoacmeibacter ruber]|uniref:N-acetyltransferase n=1 Tax=Notoacmeibacter ruber TaxID=2670375 RepID=A0A3L7JC57_9HYPH|nr:N-acetyltransferase [Notoacmeibacter ruber]RLQ88358.1 N-acetyltransferase [Notoacmeibacter ruber]
MSAPSSPVTLSQIVFTPEEPEDAGSIDTLHAGVFGPGRFARAASIIREQGSHDLSLSFTARIEGLLIGSVRLTPIAVGGERGHLLGPLAVLTDRRKLGVGKHLVNMSVEAARAVGSPFVMLVGDAPYYWSMGFRPVYTDRVRMPLPVAPDRLLVCELQSNLAECLAGNVRHVRCIDKG